MAALGVRLFVCSFVRCSIERLKCSNVNGLKTVEVLVVSVHTRNIAVRVTAQHISAKLNVLLVTRVKFASFLCSRQQTLD